MHMEVFTVGGNESIYGRYYNNKVASFKILVCCLLMLIFGTAGPISTQISLSDS